MQNICILFQTKKHTEAKAKETKENRKTKETNEEREKENVVVVNNIYGKSNGIRRRDTFDNLLFVLLTFFISQQNESAS